MELRCGRCGGKAARVRAVDRGAEAIALTRLRAARHSLPPTAHGLLGGSSMDLIEAFMRASNRAAIEDLAKLPLDDMSVRDVLENGIRLRLQRVVPYLSSWPQVREIGPASGWCGVTRHAPRPLRGTQAIAHGARPDRAPRVADVLGGYMDELWYVAGDRSTSIDWYARRAGLLSVYVATELHLLTDSSEGQTDTWCVLPSLCQIPPPLAAALSSLTLCSLTIASAVDANARAPSPRNTGLSLPGG